VRVVDEGSSNPNVPDCTPIPADADHISICKPIDRHDAVYRGVYRFVRAVLQPAKPPETSRRKERSSERININNVFGMERGDTGHYIQRTKVDDTFLAHLMGNRHVCVYGSSKQGKTALRKKHIAQADELVISCSPDWTANDIFAAILRASGAVISQSSNISTDITFSYKEKNLPERQVNLADMGDFLEVLGTLFTGQYIVVEEFHYLPEAVQGNFAFKLKAIHELSDYIFIIVGVWLEKNRLAYLNRDLNGRVAPINADEWTDDDLLRVIDEGAEKLNIAFPIGFAEALIKQACGSVYLVREACYRACDLSGIFAWSAERRVIEKTLSVRSILRDIAKDGADYPGQLINLLGSDSVPMNEQESEQGLKDWVLQSLVSATATELQRGVSLRQLGKRIFQNHPRRYNPTEAQIERVVKAVQTSQLLRAGQSLFDYDRQDKVVRCVDKGLILWRSSTNPEKINDLIFDASS
jgi:hypothetical protein